jgi:cell division protein FtsN
MTKDFANRGQSAKPAKKRARPGARKRSPRATPTRGVKGTRFHGPSFSSGAIFGAVLVLLAAYLPEWLETPPGTKEQASAEGPPAPSVTFEFPDILKDREIQVDTSPYQTENSQQSDQPADYSVQAASFRERSEADELRAKLLLSNLPATVVVSNGDTGRWFRVNLGPFDRRVDANRALTKLRERGISGIIINNTD